jgi:dienelactone hydrolase
VNYDTQLLRSADLREVVALYHAAGLSLTADLNRLNHAQRISADPSAVSYMAQNIAFNGRLAVPVLTMHTTGDGLVVPENEQAYAEAAEHAGDSSMLRQIYVDRAGHCAFTPAETITAVQALLNRVDTGRWSQAGLEPATLNARAAALGPSDNIFVAGSAVKPAAPAFLRYRPAPYLRPFTLPTW